MQKCHWEIISQSNWASCGKALVSRHNLCFIGMVQHHSSVIDMVQHHSSVIGMVQHHSSVIYMVQHHSSVIYMVQHHSSVIYMVQHHSSVIDMPWWGHHRVTSDAQGVFTPNQIPLTTIVTYLQKSYRSRISNHWAIIPAGCVVPPIYKQSKKTYCHISF